ncbi:MAG: hypothetical protein WCN98_11470 [Verrucomicrobiaceae bacterium]
MKISLLLPALTILSLSSVSAATSNFTEQRLVTVQKDAEKQGKFITFVFYQGYYNPNCPKCIADVNENNAIAKKATPHAAALTVEVYPGDRGLSKIPASVGASGGTPRVVVMDAKCEKVIASIQGKANKDAVKAFLETVKTAQKEK